VRSDDLAQPKLNSVFLLVFDGFVGEVVGPVRHEGLLADVVRLRTSGRGRDSARGVQPLDEGDLRQPVAAGGSGFSSKDLEQEPGNRTRLDEVGVGRGGDHHAQTVLVSCGYCQVARSMPPSSGWG
jgi:hypothetical protein